jgi:hypothetical protein
MLGLKTSWNSVKYKCIELLPCHSPFLNLIVFYKKVYIKYIHPSTPLANCLDFLVASSKYSFVKSCANIWWDPGFGFGNYFLIRESTGLFLSMKEGDHLNWLEIQGETHNFKLAANLNRRVNSLDFLSSCNWLLCLCQDCAAKPVMHIRNPITCKTLMFKPMKRDDVCA